MVVGVLELVLYLHENHSLKGKRSVVRSVTRRVRDKFNVTIAECDDHDDDTHRAILAGLPACRPCRQVPRRSSR